MKLSRLCFKSLFLVGIFSQTAIAQNLEDLLDDVGAKSQQHSKQAAVIAQERRSAAVESYRTQREEDVQLMLKMKSSADELSARAHELTLENERKQRELAEKRQQYEEQQRKQNEQIKARENSYQHAQTSHPYESPISTPVGAGASSTQSGGVKHSTASPLPQCVSLDRKSNAITDFMVNRCSEKVWVFWVDGGACKNRCMTHVHGNSKESIGKNKMPIITAVCPALYSAFKPEAIKEGQAYKWLGQGQYKCIRWGY